MNCGNCGKGNEYGAKICVHCGSTLALTEYFRRKGFVEKKDTPKKPKEEPWNQEILTTGYRSKRQRTQEEQELSYKEEGTAQNGQETSRRRGRAQQSEGTSRRGDNSAQTGNRRQSASATSRRESTSGKRQSQGKSASERKPDATDTRGSGTRSARQQDKGKERAQREKASQTEPKKTLEEGKGKPKKIPKSKAYNHTTKALSLAEKEVKKKTEKKRGKSRKWILPLAIVLVILIVAVGIFIGTMHFSSNEDRYTEVAEAFVRAMVMEDEGTLADYIHPKMHGSLLPLGYQNVERCDTKVVEYQEVDPLEMEQDLQSRYGMTESLKKLYRVHVGCTIHGEGTYACAMDVLVAEIEGKIYAVKTENVSDPVQN